MNACRFQQWLNVYFSQIVSDHVDFRFDFNEENYRQINIYSSTKKKLFQFQQKTSHA